MGAAQEATTATGGTHGTMSCTQNRKGAGLRLRGGQGEWNGRAGGRGGGSAARLGQQEVTCVQAAGTQQAIAEARPPPHHQEQAAGGTRQQLDCMSYRATEKAAGSLHGGQAAGTQRQGD